LHRITVEIPREAWESLPSERKAEINADLREYAMELAGVDKTKKMWYNLDKS
jgi:hypothetical protein